LAETARGPGASEQRPVTALRGVGAALAERLRRLGVTQVQDLLFVLPVDYDDRTTRTAMGALVPGMRTVVQGEIQLTDAIQGIARSGKVVGVEFTGDLLDVGTLDSWLATNAAIVWRDPELGPALRARIEELEAL